VYRLDSDRRLLIVTGLPACPGNSAFPGVESVGETLLMTPKVGTAPV